MFKCIEQRSDEKLKNNWDKTLEYNVVLDMELGLSNIIWHFYSLPPLPPHIGVQGGKGESGLGTTQGYPKQ